MKLQNNEVHPKNILSTCILIMNPLHSILPNLSVIQSLRESVQTGEICDIHMSAIPCAKFYLTYGTPSIKDLCRYLFRGEIKACIPLASNKGVCTH